MGTIPEPTITAAGPVYEGRRLDRPDEEVVDQGLRFDVGTIVTRRNILALFGVGAGSMIVAACSPAGTDLVEHDAATAAAAEGEIPDETAGPYPGNGSNGPDVLEQTGIVRSDIRSSLAGGSTAQGVPMQLNLTILDMQNNDAPFADTAVYVWHCDALGRYSMYSEGIENETYLRGVQVADADGVVNFTSIFPGCYTGRWPHIHFEVYPDVDQITDHTNAIATSQIALPQAESELVYSQAGYDGSAQNLAQLSLATDNVFGDDAGALQLATVTGNVDDGFVVHLTVRIDTATVPAVGSMPGGSGGGRPGDGGPGGLPPSRN